VLTAGLLLNNVWLIANVYKSLGAIDACKLNDVRFKNQDAVLHQSLSNFVVFTGPIWCSINRNTRGGTLEALSTFGSNTHLASNKTLPSTKQVFSLRFGLPSSTFQNSLEAAELKRSWATRPCRQLSQMIAAAR
jgi:hypothetical protein